MGVDLSVDLGGLKVKNPVMVASGTFGYGIEYSKIVDLDKLGAIVTKTITLKPKKGNPLPRILETSSGMVNSIGLENVGLEKFVGEKLPALRKITKTPVIVSIAGSTKEEYLKIAKVLNRTKGISAIELNISCPNVKGKAISQDENLTFELVKSVRKNTDLPLIAKLSPNVTDITKIAVASEKAGADVLSLINSLGGIIVATKKSGHFFCGLSGPAIKPVALRMVWDVFRAVRIPIIGIGGITTGRDALEYMLAGAAAVGAGSGFFSNPALMDEIYDTLNDFLAKNGKSLADITGSLNEKEQGKGTENSTEARV